MVVAADLNERSQRSRLSVSKTVEDSQTISMVTGKRPKAVSLDSYDRQYYLLLMFYQVMNLLSVIQSKEHIEGRMVELLDIARSILLYQGDSIAVWLEVCTLLLLFYSRSMHYVWVMLRRMCSDMRSVFLRAFKCTGMLLLGRPICLRSVLLKGWRTGPWLA